MNVTKKILAVLALQMLICTMLSAQDRNAVRSHYAMSKLSSSVRTLVHGQGGASKAKAISSSSARVCALVRTANAASLTDNGCRPITSIGDIYVVDIPMSRLMNLASDSRVCRIEAEHGNALQLDSMAIYTNATDIYTGNNLPQPFTGKGVVVGSMDVGYDLTHPTFLDADGTSCRIRRFWDQLSTDTIDSRMYVGAEYTSAEAIRDYAHSRDGLKMYHGTHTLGIAAGNGAGTRYVGMAPESDLCLVSNAVSGDEEFIADDDMYKYTTATDVLGFKYIFDYAESVGKPCVISFSEGAPQDFRGDNQLFYEALDRLVGPGRILVASAGNNGTARSYVGKPVGRESAGTFVTPPDNYIRMTVRTRGKVSMLTIFNYVHESDFVSKSPRANFYASGQVIIEVPVGDVCAAADSLLSDTILLNGVEYVQTMHAYHSCFDPADIIVDVTLSSPESTWLWANEHKTSFKVCGVDALAEMFPVHGSFAADTALDDADATHNILSPGSAPSVICVGATAYRPEYTDVYDYRHVTQWGPSGERVSFSSVGPTFDGRTKPDVMAPGANIISAMSSYYMDNNVAQTLVARQEHGGRTYGWSADGGTSMSTPAVAGIIALWLEANPNLSPDGVRSVLQRTCKPCGDYGSETSNYCGYGAIDAYAGLLDVLGMTGIEGLSAGNPRGVEVRVEHGNTLRLVFNEPLAQTEHIRLYGVDGRRFLEHVLEPGLTDYAIKTDVPTGIYAVQVGHNLSLIHI